MKIFVQLICLFGILFAFTNATKVQQCSEARTPQLPEDDVFISNCARKICQLKRNKQTTVEFKFSPEKEITSLVNEVTGAIIGVPLPFVGVDGTNACENIYAEDKETKVGCPLKAGEKYWYKRTIDVLEIYPKVSVQVRWAIKDNDGDVACFQVPAKIV